MPPIFVFIVVWIYRYFQIGLTQVLTGENGTIQSPNFPSIYENNLLRIWSIIPESGGQVILFFNTFDVDNSSNCQGDRVTVTDIEGSKHFCGKKDKFSHIGAGSVNISFVSDTVSNNNTGFELEYVVCGGMFKTMEGLLRTPVISFPHPQFDCNFHITLPENQTAIKINFEEKNFERSNGDQIICLLEFDESGKSNCSDIREYISMTNTLTLTVTMIDDVTPALHATYRKYDCNRAITKTSGVIQSPRYPEFSSRDSICDYSIQFSVPSGKIIEIIFTDKDVPCGESTDSLQIINPTLPDDSSSEICKNSLKETFFMSGGSVLRFSSTADDPTKARFSANFSLIDLNNDNDPKTTPSNGISTEGGNQELPNQIPANVTSPADKTFSITVTIGAATGGIVGIVIILALGCILYKKRFKSPPGDSVGSPRGERDILNASSNNMNIDNIYTEANTETHKVGQTNFGGEYMEVSDAISNKQEGIKTETNEVLYQETAEGEYDLLHQNRKKVELLEEKVYDVSSPDDGMYSETNVKPTPNNNDVENMYDHAKALPPGDNMYDTAIQRHEK